MIFLLCALSGVALGASAAPAADQYAAVKVHTLSSTWYVSPAAAVSQPALAYTHTAARSLAGSFSLSLANVTHRAHAVGVFALVLLRLGTVALLFLLGMCFSLGGAS